MSSRGFTLVELVLVITILAVISVAAVPKFFDTVDVADQSSREATVNTVRNAIASERAGNMLSSGFGSGYPADLGDGNSPIADCSSVGCFSGLLVTPVKDPHWSFDGTATYTFTEGGGTTYAYTYNSSDGSFD